MVYIILGTGFEEAEALIPCDLLRRAGYEIAELKKDTADITRAVLARKREEG